MSIVSDTSLPPETQKGMAMPEVPSFLPIQTLPLCLFKSSPSTNAFFNEETNLQGRETVNKQWVTLFKANRVSILGNNTV